MNKLLPLFICLPLCGMQRTASAPSIVITVDNKPNLTVDVQSSADSISTCMNELCERYVEISESFEKMLESDNYDQTLLQLLLGSCREMAHKADVIDSRKWMYKYRTLEEQIEVALFVAREEKDEAGNNL